MNIKRFLIRKIFRKVYDPEEILDIPFKDMNTAEIKVFMKIMYTEITEVKNNIARLVNYMSEIPAPCDKCNEETAVCFKCENTGIVKNKNLCGWPWE
jgi:hypothetical protein